MPQILFLNAVFIVGCLAGYLSANVVWFGLGTGLGYLIAQSELRERFLQMMRDKAEEEED